MLGGAKVNKPLFQAMIYVLDDPQYSELRQHFVHSRTGKCLVRGIVFFGTPFEGSWLANVFAPIIKLWQGDSSFVMSLRIKNHDVASIVSKFEDVRSKKDYEIPLTIFYEKKKLKKFIFQVLVSSLSRKRC